MSTELTVTKITHAGITPATVAVIDAGNHFVNTGRCFLYVKSGAAEWDVTIVSQAKCSFNHDHHLLVPCALGVTVITLIGPFPKSRFDDAEGKVQITWEAGANGGGVEAAVIELP